MANIPIKVLKDKNQNAFVPFTVTDAVFVPDSDVTVNEVLDEQIERINEAIASIENIPTKTSDLENDSDFISDSNYVHTDNNFTNTEKSKLNGIDSGAEVNVIENIEVNGVTQVIDANKNVNITVPTKVSDINNDLSFIDNTVSNLVNYYTKTEVDNKVSSVYKYKGSVNAYVDLPSSGQVVGDVYNVVAADTTHGIPAGGNVAWNGTAWDYLGGDIDLSDYYTKSQVDTSLNTKVDKVTGKQLSTEDYTSAEKTKLSNIEANADVNLIESISVNNTIVSPVNKAVNISIKTINNESLLGTGDITIAGGSIVIGTIVAWAGESPAPEGWLLCDGKAVSRTTYADLFSVISTTYGSGNGSTTFNVPNLKGRVPVGRDVEYDEFSPLGKKGGEKAHVLLESEMPTHTHGTYASGGSAGYPYRIPQTDGINSANTSFCDTMPTGGGQAHNNLQPYIVVNYIIKAKYV